MNDQTYKQNLLKKLNKSLLLPRQEKQFWSRKIPSMPKPALEYLDRLLTEADQKFKKSLSKSLQKDSKGRLWKDLIKFRKEQIKKISDSVSEQDASDADVYLTEQFKDI